MIKFKSPQGVQRTLSLMGKVRNLFAVAVGIYTNNAAEQRHAFAEAKAIWHDAALQAIFA